MDHAAAQRINARPGQVRFRAPQGDLGGIVHVLQVESAGEPDRVRAPDDRGLDRFGRTRGHALVPPDAVHGPRPKSHARDPVAGEVDARVPFVALLEHAVVRSGQEECAFGDGRAAVELLGPKDCGGAGVDDPLHKIAPAARHLEDVQRAQHVDLGAAHGVGRARGHLERCPVDDVSDAVLGHRPVQVLEADHVAANEAQALRLLVGQQGAQAVGFGVGVKDIGVVAALDQVLHNPGADETFGAGNEEASVIRRPFVRLSHAWAL